MSWLYNWTMDNSIVDIESKGKGKWEWFFEITYMI